jgi:hypothetical protein
MTAMRNLGLAFAMLLLSTAACGSSDPAADAAPGAPDARVIVKADADVDVPDASTLPTGACRQQSDCAPGGNICYGPNDPMCGIPPMQECDDDSTCGKGQVCHSSLDTCSPDRVGSLCGFPCIGAGAPQCSEGFTCDGTGHCRADRCGGKGAFQCPASQACDPTTIDTELPAHAVTHGCVVAACTTDATCPTDTRCVNGRCQDSFGACSPPVP